MFLYKKILFLFFNFQKNDFFLNHFVFKPFYSKYYAAIYLHITASEIDPAPVSPAIPKST